MQDTATPDRLPNFAVIAREWAWQQPISPPARKLVLLAVCERINHGNGTAWPGADYLARACGLNRRQTQNHLAALVSDDLLVVTRRDHGKGRPYPVYTVPPLVQYAALSPEMVQPAAQTSQRNGVLSAAERTKLVQPSAQTLVQPSAPEPLTVEPVTVNPGGAAPLPPTPIRPAPKPKAPIVPNGTRIGDYIAYLTNHGHEDLASVSGQDKAFIAGATFDVEDFAACMVAIADGTWGDAWIKGRFSIRNVHQYRWPQWITRGTPTAPPAPGTVPDRFKGPNGQPDTTASLHGWMQRRKAREEAARDRAQTAGDDRGGVHPALPAPRPRL